LLDFWVPNITPVFIKFITSAWFEDYWVAFIPFTVFRVDFFNDFFVDKSRWKLLVAKVSDLFEGFEVSVFFVICEFFALA
jgi:hypothetical protein